MFLASNGAVWDAVTTRLGTSRDSVRRALTRAGRVDVIRALERATYGDPTLITKGDARASARTPAERAARAAA